MSKLTVLVSGFAAILITIVGCKSTIDDENAINKKFLAEVVKKDSANSYDKMKFALFEDSRAKKLATDIDSVSSHNQQLMQEIGKKVATKPDSLLSNLLTYINQKNLLLQLEKEINLLALSAKNNMDNWVSAKNESRSMNSSDWSSYYSNEEKIRAVISIDRSSGNVRSQMVEIIKRLDNYIELSQKLSDLEVKLTKSLTTEKIYLYNSVNINKESSLKIVKKQLKEYKEALPYWH